ncbi:hypothetical protein L798_06055 [Zootermopsis nevadensis]|uniref:Uncharacterized protein n=1 Tax=Zootermopsis nevadensis TaxID=136037 RepID=A0A067QET7_ZOONE|nr:hypothetical protein L798_06055 [Zootermopsis nevadensis]
MLTLPSATTGKITITPNLEPNLFPPIQFRIQTNSSHVLFLRQLTSKRGRVMATSDHKPSRAEEWKGEGKERLQLIGWPDTKDSQKSWLGHLTDGQAASCGQANN